MLHFPAHKMPVDFPSGSFTHALALVLVLVPLLWFHGNRLLTLYYASLRTPQWRRPASGTHKDAALVVRGTKCRAPYGDFLELAGDARKFWQGKRDRFGDVYYIWLGCVPHLVVASAAAAKDALKDQHTHYRDRDFGLGYVFERLMGHCVGVLTGPDWKRVRGAFHQSFSAGSVRLHADVIDEETDRWIAEWLGEDDVPTATSGRKTLDITAALKLFPFHVVVRVIFGDDLTASEMAVLRRLLGYYQELLELVFKKTVTRFRVYRFCFWARYNVVMNELDREWQGFVLRKMESYRGKDLGRRDTMYLVAKAIENGTANMSSKELYQTLGELLFANLDISMGVTAWCVTDMALHTDAQAKLRASLRGDGGVSGGGGVNCGGGDSISSNSSSSSSAAAGEKSAHGARHSDYLKAVLKESSRHHPIFAVTVPEKTSAPETVIGGFRVPRGTPVVLDIYSINQHPDDWDGPSEFRPERHLVDRPPPIAQYGMGPRTCIGYRFADGFMGALLTKLVARFEIGLADPLHQGAGAAGAAGCKDAFGIKRRLENTFICPDVRLTFRRLPDR